MRPPCVGHRRDFGRGKPVAAMSWGGRVSIRAHNHSLIDVQVDRFLRTSRHPIAPHRSAPIRRLLKPLFPSFIKSDLPIWKSRRLPRQLHDRLPYLAAIGEGLQQKTFIAFLDHFDLGWFLRHLINGGSAGLDENKKAPNMSGPRLLCRGTSAYAAEAFLLTPLRSATLLSLVFAAFSSFRFVVNNRTTSS